MTRPQRQCCADGLPIYLALIHSRLSLLVRNVAIHRGRDAGIAGRRRDGVGEVAGGLVESCFGHLVGEHAEFAPPNRVRGLGKGVVLLEDDADVFAGFVLGGVAVVGYVPGDFGMDGVVTALCIKWSDVARWRLGSKVWTYHEAAISRKPVCASLLEQDVAWHDILTTRFLCA